MFPSESHSHTSYTQYKCNYSCSPVRVELSAGFVQWMLLVVSKHFQDQWIGLEVLDECWAHWHTHLRGER